MSWPTTCLQVVDASAPVLRRAHRGQEHPAGGWVCGTCVLHAHAFFFQLWDSGSPALHHPGSYPYFYYTVPLLAQFDYVLALNPEWAKQPVAPGLRAAHDELAHTANQGEMWNAVMVRSAALVLRPRAFVFSCPLWVSRSAPLHDP